MLGELAAALAGAGGSALVGAMATDAWQATRSGVARLFGRGGPERQRAIEAQLDDNAALVAQAEDPEAARQSLVPVWRLQLETLLGQHPEVEEELRALVAQVREALPAPQQTWVQTNIARDQARQNIVQHGTLHVHPSQMELPQALTAAEESVTLYDGLVQRLPQAFANDRYGALATLADVLDGLDRSQEAANIRHRIDHHE